MSLSAEAAAPSFSFDSLPRHSGYVLVGIASELVAEALSVASFVIVAITAQTIKLDF